MAQKSTNRSAGKPAASKPVTPNQGLARLSRMSRPTTMKSTRSALNTSSAFGASSSYHEAASNSPRVEYAPDYGPNAANGELATLRRRSRWTYANDAYYRNACKQLANNAVHYGIKPRIKDPVLRKIWRKWVRESDARGSTDFYGQQHAAVVSMARDGEVFIRMRQRRPEDMKSGIPFQLQMLEADYVPLDKCERGANGNVIISGIEKNAIDRVEAYWMHDHHPNDLIRLGAMGMPRRVSGADVLHVYSEERSEAMRGVPWGAPALNKAEGLKTYDEAELERKKGNAMHGGFITPPLGEEGKPTHGVVGQDDDGIDFAGMTPGTWTVTPAGYEIEFAAPQGNDQNYPVYRREGMSEVAVSFGLSVEHVTLNFEKLNDRQWRANNLEITRGLESVQNHIVVQRGCQPVWERFVSAAYIAGLWKPAAGKTVEDYFDVEWICPARGHIHPVQEVAALIEAVKHGFISRKRVSAAFGEDVEDIDEENALDQARAQRLGLQYPVYPALASLDFAAILAASLTADQIEDITSDGESSDAGSIMSAG